jgi:3-phenylpropionate/trans-cinnamate dioxygenase ferredoxin reductase subunit
MIAPVLVVGAGQAGFQLALSLRDQGYDGPVTLIGDETPDPYQRPPLSKDYLTAKEVPSSELVALRPASFYQDRDITLRTGQLAVAIHRSERVVELDSGERIGYGHLVLATGANPLVPMLPGADLDGVLTLRTLPEAQRLRDRLGAPGRLVVVGGGFIGMEVAAAASRAGQQVTVVEAADRILGRVISPEIGDRLHHRHQREGVDIRIGAQVAALGGEDGASPRGAAR